MPVRLISALVLILLLGYGAWKASALLLGPSIVLTSPQDGETIPDGVVRIQGVAHRTETLTFDGAPFLIDTHGGFAGSLVLPQGNGILTLTAADRFGRTRTETRTVFVPKSTTSISSSSLPYAKEASSQEKSRTETSR